jgi:hypothetical protein
MAMDNKFHATVEVTIGQVTEKRSYSLNYWHTIPEEVAKDIKAMAELARAKNEVKERQQQGESNG